MSEQPAKRPILDTVIEMGVMRMRAAIGPASQVGPRPRICLWVDQRSGMILHFEVSEPLESYVSLVMNSLEGVIQQLGGFPREIQLRDPKLAGELKELINPQVVKVVVRESLPMLDEALEGMMGSQALSGKPQPGLFDQPQITLDHVIAFAEAARAFYEAAPWRHLIDDDLIAIESPRGPKGTEFTQVLGAGGKTFGLGFVPTRQAHEDLNEGRGIPRGGIWSLLFGDIDSLPFDDGEAWANHSLTVAGSKAYPSFVRISKARKLTQPTPEQLTWAEGLLRALAASTEQEFDQGRWEKQVETFTGPATYKFSLPILLEQMDEMNVDAPQTAALATPAERAEALCAQARQARGRREGQLVRQALAIDPDCGEALLLLTERTSDPQSSLPLYERAVTAAEKRLGASRFQNDAGHFWGIVETRPYMFARQRLAMTLMRLGRLDEAAGHLRELLRLNPGDHQGNRYYLMRCLLFADQLDSLDEFLNASEYKDDADIEWTFMRLLSAYRRQGDSPSAIQRLAEAQQRNPFVIPMLTGRVPIPFNPPPSYSPGSKEEAAVSANDISALWEDYPDALAWLDAAAAKARKHDKKAKREQQNR